MQDITNYKLQRILNTLETSFENLHAKRVTNVDRGFNSKPFDSETIARFHPPILSICAIRNVCKTNPEAVQEKKVYLHWRIWSAIFHKYNNHRPLTSIHLNIYQFSIHLLCRYIDID